jgi:hypothetical protein
MTRPDRKRGPWLRLYVALLHSDAFMDLSDSAVALYLKLYLLAKRADAENDNPPGTIGGERGPYTFQQIAKHLFYTGNEGVLQSALNELIQAGLIDQERGNYRVSDYEYEQETYSQYADRKAKTAARVAAHRARAQDDQADPEPVEGNPLDPGRRLVICKRLKISDAKAAEFATGEPSFYVDLLKNIKTKQGAGHELAAAELALIDEHQTAQAQAARMNRNAETLISIDPMPTTEAGELARLQSKQRTAPAFFSPAEAARLAELEAKFSKIAV